MKREKPASQKKPVGTKTKKATGFAKELKESEDLFRKIVKNSPVGIALVTPDFRFFCVNPVFVAMTGYSESELLTMSFSDVMDPDQHPGVRDNLRELADGTIPVYSTEKQYVRKDKSLLWCLLKVTAIRDQRGSLICFAAQIEDISKRKLGEARLSENCAYNRGLIEASTDPLVTISYDGKIQDVNTATETATGLTRNELIGTSFSEYFTEPAMAREGYSRVFTDGKILDYPLEIRHRDGHTIPVLYNAIVYHDSDGNVKGVFAAARDITEPRRVENLLRDSELRYRKLVENLPDVIFMIDKDGLITYISPAAERLFGYSPPDLPGRRFMDIVYPEDVPDLIRRFGEISKGIIRPFEWRLVHPDGSHSWVRTSINPVDDTEGSSGVLGVISDISWEKKAKETLLESEEKFRNVFDLANDAVMLHTLTTNESPGRFIDVNQVTCSMLGYSRDELFTMGPPAIVPAELHPQLGEIIRQTGTKKTVLFETRFQRKDGTTFPVESSGHLIPYRGELIWISHIRDITRRKEVEELREHLISELAKKNTELDRFTYTVSHDLKSPLIAIRAFLSLLEQDLKSGTAEQVKADITRISESAEKLESLINTLLALSRSGKSVDNQVLIPFSDLAHDAVRILEPSWHNRMITVIIPERMPVVSGDQQRLLQVMTNLIDNAARFMDDQQEPCIKIGVQGDAGTPVFFVQDNGMGIKKENLSKIFGLFERFNPDIPGTGIGLATVKKIIEAHGGKIWAESEGLGKGTTVCFTLPVKR
jgi:PAS domain S-box-containing protein